ncbi:hypothetical protein Pst134EB_027288 [Puccinia striiformis f. sp. tritici]|nr:hypothetical protein Pst134EB_027288 [Puccinia striiformis f. sp. tritici]
MISAHSFPPAPIPPPPGPIHSILHAERKSGLINQSSGPPATATTRLTIQPFDPADLKFWTWNVGILRLGRNAISGASVFIQVVTESFFFSHPLSALHSLIVPFPCATSSLK